jgi:hypothetical protein
MGMITLRNAVGQREGGERSEPGGHDAPAEPEERQTRPMTYWRRRFLALVVGLVVLAVLAWAFSGVLGAHASGSPAASVSHESQGHEAHSGASGSGAGGSGASGSGGGSTIGARNAPSRAPGSGAAAGRASGALAPSPRRPGRSSAPGGGPTSSAAPRDCQPGDVVISLSSSQNGYGQGQLPEFSVDVVSTAAQTCAFNVGPKFLALVITAGGKRIWSSADCVGGRGSLLTSLARGVPTVLPISWDRETSAPGCALLSRRVPSGRFTATASGGGTASNSITFTLR